MKYDPTRLVYRLNKHKSIAIVQFISFGKKSTARMRHIFCIQ